MNLNTNHTNDNNIAISNHLLIPNVINPRKVSLAVENPQNTPSNNRNNREQPLSINQQQIAQQLQDFTMSNFAKPNPPNAKSSDNSNSGELSMEETNARIPGEQKGSFKNVQHNFISTKSLKNAFTASGERQFAVGPKMNFNPEGPTALKSLKSLGDE